MNKIFVIGTMTLVMIAFAVSVLNAFNEGNFWASVASGIFGIAALICFAPTLRNKK